MKFYFAGSFNRRNELRNYAQQLTYLGHHVTSRWLFTDHEVIPEGPRMSEALSPESKAFRYATEDLEDILTATGFVLFSGIGQPRRGRGGRHVELGYAMAKDRIIILIGERENAFMSHIPDTMVFPDFVAFRDSDFLKHAETIFV